MEIMYEGIFFSGEEAEKIKSLDTNKLSRVNGRLHCTFKYKPKHEEIFDEIVGKQYEVEIVGYGNDCQNSGFSVILPKELKKYYINYDEQNIESLKIPHITVSLAENAKAANTKNLDFKKLERPIRVTGTFGYCIRDKGKERISFNPYKINKR